MKIAGNWQKKVAFPFKIFMQVFVWQKGIKNEY